MLFEIRFWFHFAPWNPKIVTLLIETQNLLPLYFLKLKIHLFFLVTFYK